MDEGTKEGFCVKATLSNFKDAVADIHGSVRLFGWLFSRRRRSRRRSSPRPSPSPKPTASKSPPPSHTTTNGPAAPSPRRKKSSLFGKLFIGLFKLFATVVPTLRRRSRPTEYEEYQNDKSHVQPQEYVERSSEGISQTASWTKGLPLGESCTYEGPRYSIPLVCKGNYCVHRQDAQTSTSKKEFDEIIWRHGQREEARGSVHGRG